MNNKTVYLKDCLEGVNLKDYNIPIILGKDTKGNIIVKDLVDIPNILMAGSSGTGKSVFLNSVIYTLLNNKTPEELKFVMIDPKQSELPFWNGIPHLLHPVVTSHKDFYSILKVSESELDSRLWLDDIDNLPYILVLVDEFSDLMLNDSNIPPLIYILAEKGSKVKMHMILSTSSPRDRIFTKEIKDLIPGRLVGGLANKEDSGNVLGVSGAEELEGNGDMFYRDMRSGEIMRVQVPLVSTEEQKNMIEEIKKG